MLYQDAYKIFSILVYEYDIEWKDRFIHLMMIEYNIWRYRGMDHENAISKGIKIFNTASYLKLHNNFPGSPPAMQPRL